MQFLETVFYFVVTLGVLVFVHEFGHFIAAKLCGMRVDRFSIGFPPRAFGKKIGDTDYCVSWIPIGGYVKIAGMIDESFDTEFVQKEPQPWEYRAKPIWQRMIVISAGVIMNILLAIAIFWGINYVQGETIKNTTEIAYVVAGSPAERGGLKPGDKVISINGVQVAHWDQILTSVYLESMGHDVTFLVMRNGAETQVFIPRAQIPEPNETPFGIVPPHTEVVVREVDPGMPAGKAGMKPLDVILSIGGTKIQYDLSVREIVRTHAGKPLEIEWRRNGQTMTATITPTSDSLIGIKFGPRYTGPISRREFTLIEALPKGFGDVINISRLAVQQIWQLITGRIPFGKSVGGPVRIAQAATQNAEMGLITYLGFMALLSISLAILNILPFPALDGGHLLFLIYEGLFRREIPVKVKLGLQRAGFVLLLVFMAFVIMNDIINF
jgi:regulator of sigma E protease